MYTLLEAQNLVEKHIQNLSLPDSPPELYEPIKYILSLGGKRIRPALVLLSCQIFSDTVDNALLPAVAIEVFHNFTLVHDDIMDRSDMRRGHPAVHVKFDENIALLSGDAMSILASRLMNQAPNPVLGDVHDIFTRTAIQVCEGQQFDMNFEKKLEVSEADYLKMIKLKTAVLIAASLEIGALLGGASQSDSHALYEFGLNLGMAFQLQDDVLDTYGDPSLTGKKLGTDIVHNKKTLLIIEALDRATPKLKEELCDWLTCEQFNPEEKISAVRTIFDQLNVKEVCEAKIDAYYEAAFERLDKLNREEDRKTELRNFASFLRNRKY